MAAQSLAIIERLDPGHLVGIILVGMTAKGLCLRRGMLFDPFLAVEGAKLHDDGGVLRHRPLVLAGFEPGEHLAVGGFDILYRVGCARLDFLIPIIAFALLHPGSAQVHIERAVAIDVGHVFPVQPAVDVQGQFVWKIRPDYSVKTTLPFYGTDHAATVRTVSVIIDILE